LEKNAPKANIYDYARKLKKEITLMNMFDLKGEVAVVTGGGGLLGWQYVSILLSAGASVAVLDKKFYPSENLKDNLLKEMGYPYVYHVTDIISKGSVDRCFTEIVGTLGTPTILINNAGADSRPNASEKDNGPFEDVPEEAWRVFLDSHLTGAFLVSQAFIREYKKAFNKGDVRNGSIINISSTYGLVSPDQDVYDFRRKNGGKYYKPVGYSVAKSGVFNFTRWLAEYAAPYGVRVNTLVPGGVLEKQDPEFIREYKKRTMLKRMASADDYNGAVLFLASHKASGYMTGSSIVVDGGWTAR